MWWKLPIEIIEQILEHVDFPDYVSLTQVNSTLRDTLDNERLFLVVLESNYGRFIEAYDWPIDAAISKTSLWTAFGHLRIFLDSVDIIYPTYQVLDASEHSSRAHVSRALDEEDLSFFELRRATKHVPTLESDVDYRRKVVLNVALNTLATQSIYAFPLITELEKAQATLNAKLSGQSDLTLIPLSKLSWSRRLLQLQNFGQAVKFFRETECSNTADIEKCYFELSRCYIDFHNLAHHRRSKLDKMRAALRAKLPISKGALKFLSTNAYRAFLESLISAVLPFLSSRNSHIGQGGNILRIYQERGLESQLLYLSILAKVLGEEVFDKLSIRISDLGSEKFRVRLSPFFLIVGATYVLIDFDIHLLSIYSESDLHRLPVASTAQVKTPMKCSDVIQRAFELIQTGADLTSNIDSIDWTNRQLNTSQEKLRFIRMILIPVNENKDLDYSHFSPLIHENDFFLYFFCAQAQIGQSTSENHAFLDYINRFSHKSSSNGKFGIGEIVANNTSNYFGTIIGFDEAASDHDAYIKTLPFDRVERSIAHENSLRSLISSDLGDKLEPFLKWLISTEGFIHAGMFMFSSLSIEGSKLRLVGCSESKWLAQNNS